MNLQEKKTLKEYLCTFLADTRKAKLDEVIEKRLKNLEVVLEDVYQEHNASAVLRSCDCFGVQNVHFIEKRNTYKISADVAMGASNWLSIHRHTAKENNTQNCLSQLKERGFYIVATSPHTQNTLEDIPTNKPIALVFGTEISGISKEVIEKSDLLVKIPMYGFTESFNISVSVAICLHYLTEKIRLKPEGFEYNDEEKTGIYLEWLKNNLPLHEQIIKEYNKRKNN